MKYLYLSIILSLSSTLGNSQAIQNNHWLLSTQDINFSAVNPVSATVSGISSPNNYGLATISDDSGNLLFYTNGVTVWNKLHNTMTNGTSINNSAAVPAINVIITRNPGNVNQYYIFTSANSTCLCEGIAPSYYTYSIIEFNVGNPLGYVMFINTSPSEYLETNYSINLTDGENILKNDFYFGPLTITKNSTNDGYWIIAQSFNKIFSFKIDQTGFNTVPVSSTLTNAQIYNIGTIGSNSSGVDGVEAAQFRITPDNGKLVGLLYGNGNSDFDYGRFYTLNFNASTGVLSNYQLLQNLFKVNNFEISNNSQFLYYIRSPQYSYEQMNNGELVVRDLLNASVVPRVLYETVSTTTRSQKFSYLQKDRKGKILISSVFTDLNRDKYVHQINGQDSFATSSVGINYVYLNNKSISRLPQLVPDLKLCRPLILINELNSSSFVYDGYSNITTSTNYTIGSSSQDIIMKANDFIFLGPNTTINSGAKFLAQIESCSPIIVSRYSERTEDIKKTGVESKLLIYPNPSSQLILINAQNKIISNMAIFSIDGRQIVEFKSVNEINREVDISLFKEGLYLISLETTDGKVLTGKFIKI